MKWIGRIDETIQFQGIFIDERRVSSMTTEENETLTHTYFQEKTEIQMLAVELVRVYE